MLKILQVRLQQYVNCELPDVQAGFRKGRGKEKKDTGKSCPTLTIPQTVAHQAPLSLGFSKQEYWSGLPFPSPGNLSNPGTERRSPPLQADALPTELRRKPQGRGTRDQIANIHWIIEKARESQKNIYFCFIDYAKAFDYVDHNKLWKILKEMGISDHLPASWEICMQVRKQELELDMEQTD